MSEQINAFGRAIEAKNVSQYFALFSSRNENSKESRRMSEQINAFGRAIEARGIWNLRANFGGQSWNKGGRETFSQSL